jgi:hypothetical protein
MFFSKNEFTGALLLGLCLEVKIYNAAAKV